MATVIAFYFGVRGAESATDKALLARRRKAPGQGDQPGPPKITGSYPLRDQSNIDVSTQIVTIFSEPIDSTTVTKDTFNLRKEGSNINEDVEYVRIENNTTAVLQPKGKLEYGKNTRSQYRKK